MLTRQCCCTDVCCDPFLTTNFVTIFGDELDSAVPVSSEDLIVLKIKRPPSRMSGFETSFETDSQGTQVACNTCCRNCDTCACDACNAGLEQSCDNPNSIVGSGIGDYGAPCVSCRTLLCGRTSPLTSNIRQEGAEESTKTVPNILKKFFNKVLPNPPSYAAQYNIKTIEKLQSLPTSTQIYNPSNQSKNQNLEVSFTATGENGVFKEKINSSYPLCKSCLEAKGYDIDCIRNNNLDCIGKKVNFCAECSAECDAFCDSSYGDTENQKENIKTILSNYDYIENFATIKEDKDTAILYSGKEVETSSALQGQEEPSVFVEDLPSMLNDPDVGVPPGGGGTSTPPGFPEQTCSVCNNKSGAPGGAPLYVIYRYSYCSLVWFPPEFLFGYDTKISQGNGWKKIINNQPTIRTCDFLFSGVNLQDGFENDQEVSCISNFANNCVNGCDPCRDSASYPCQCGFYPHISGGLHDTSKKRFNMSRTRFYGGYIPSLNPFNPATKVSEIGCNTCASARVYVMSCKGFYDIKKAANAGWPKASQLGAKSTTIGSYCNIDQNHPLGSVYPYYNPNYNLECFVRGISPYLSRIAAVQHRLGYDIFHYGSYYPPEYEVLGPTYINSAVQDGDGELNTWSKVSFKKAYGKKNLLFHKMVGLVGIEHFFEAWAYHSKSLFASQPPIAMNSCNLLVIPYERPYAGTVKPTSFSYDPREALRYQLMRGIPRTVMYGSSTVPIFFADIYAMEVKSKKKEIALDGKQFDSEEFLEKFYLYFYNMTTRKGETTSNTTEPLVLPEDVDLFNYVEFWLKTMIKENILSIKDHAPDIASELIETLNDVTFTENDPDERDPQFATEMSRALIGGSGGYFELKNYLIQLTGLCGPNIPLQTIKNSINGTVIKGMVNTRSMLRSDAPGPMFLGPRRVTLLPTPAEAGITAWGCSGGCSMYSPSPIPPSFGDDQLTYESLYSGLGTWFAVTENGKVRAFGDDSIPECAVDTDPNNFRQSLGCIPEHLNYTSDSNSDLVAFQEASDGYVRKVSSKGNFAVALVEYQAGEAIGQIQGNPNGSDFAKQLFSNSGNFALNTSTGQVQSTLSPFENSCSSLAVTDSVAYTLKAWGPQNQYGIFYDKTIPSGTLKYRSPTCLNGDEGTITLPTGQVITETQLFNKSFMWKDVACGTKHAVALTTDGTVFVSPNSDNTYGQASYGIPTDTGSITGQPLNAPSDSYGMQYYLHFPKPDYFTDEEWSNLIAYFDSFEKQYCKRDINSPYPCDIRCYLFNVVPPISLLPDGEWGGNAINYPPDNDTSPDRPVYTAVAAGHYHSIALSSDNNLKIWGQYVKIKENGDVLPKTVEDSEGNTGIDPIDVFLPEGEIYKDIWTLGGYTYGCQDVSPSEENVLIPTTAQKEIYSGRAIFAIDGGPDYSILARKDGNSDRFVIWGHSEMVSAVSGIEYSGMTAQASVNYYKIQKIVAGANAVAVLYKNSSETQNQLDIYIRPSKDPNGSYDYGVLSELPDKYFNDVCLTSQSAAGLFEEGLEAHRWDPRSFTPVTGHDLLQFKDYAGLPPYFKSQAFFRAVPGRWDFSKFLYGRPCHLLGTQYLRNVVATMDKCSIYYKKGENNINLSYTGHPKYYWMRNNWRRIQQTTPLHTYDPGKNTGCGLLRNSKGEDGLTPDEFGTGGPTNTPLANANRSLNTLLGGCYNGDICWIGDGSPSPYAYSARDFSYYSGKKCMCRELTCNCPPECRTAMDFNCQPNTPYAGTICFEGPIFGRSGFNSNKDYFVQSHKSFGKVGRSAGPYGNADCCGVIKTNITHFYYAKRSYYYAYNFDTKLYDVEEAPLKYRTYFLGGATAYELPPAGSSFQITAALVNTLMTPRNSIPSAYQVDAEMSYPYVYCGGFNLKVVKENMSDALGRSNLNCQPVCDPTAYCRGESCPPNSVIIQTGGCFISQPGDKLLGPGGWIYVPTRWSCEGGLEPVVQNNLLNTSAVINEQSLTLPAGASDNYLGPLVGFKEYDGTLPPGFADRFKFCFVGDRCPCGSGAATCPGCTFICGEAALYSVMFEKSIDDPSFYWPPDKPVTAIASYSNEELKQLDNTLFRVYEFVSARYFVPGVSGTTGGAICFIGGDDLAQAGDFIAYAYPPNPNFPEILDVIGKAANVLCKDID